jgi:hypothetical protein
MEENTMTNITKHIIIAAAALTIAAGVAGAQTIKAEVPFGFRVAGTVLPAGSYSLSANQTSGGGLAVFKLTQDNTHRSILTIPYANNIQKDGGTSASLTFECSGADCTLVEVAPGTGQAYRLWKSRTENDGNTRLAVIRAFVANAR